MPWRFPFFSLSGLQEAMKICGNGEENSPMTSRRKTARWYQPLGSTALLCKADNLLVPSPGNPLASKHSSTQVMHTVGKHSCSNLLCQCQRDKNQPCWWSKVGEGRGVHRQCAERWERSLVSGAEHWLMHQLLLLTSSSAQWCLSSSLSAHF